MQHLNIRVEGKVQGVFFRASARQQADLLGVTGFARNEPDNSVYIEAEGDEESLATFLAWLAEGPPAARVDKVSKEPGPLRHFSGFEIQ